MRTASGLRSATVRVLASLGAEDIRPMDLAKRLGLDKSLSWKLSQMAQSKEVAAILEQVPGSAAYTIFLRAADRAGADAELLLSAQQALASFDAAVHKHAGDRATLELVVDALSGKRRGKLETSRKLAFRGNSGIWGVQARVRVQAGIVVPNAEDGSMLDTAMVGGWVDFKRLRSDARWAIFRRAARKADPEQHRPTQAREEPIDPKSDAGEAAGLSLLKEFCSPSMPEINALQEEHVTVYELGQSAVGNTGAFDCFFGTVVRKVGARKPVAPERPGMIGAQISAPVETLLFDMLVHKDIALASTPAVQVYGQLIAGFSPKTNRDLLPLDHPVEEMQGEQLADETPVLPKYGEVMEHVVGRLGFALGDFTVYRFTLEYPPFPSTVMMDIPTAP